MIPCRLFAVGSIILVLLLRTSLRRFENTYSAVTWASVLVRPSVIRMMMSETSGRSPFISLNKISLVTDRPCARFVSPPVYLRFVIALQQIAIKLFFHCNIIIRAHLIMYYSCFKYKIETHTSRQVLMRLYLDYTWPEDPHHNTGSIESSHQPCC